MAHRPTHAVVLGGGLAGTLAAAALARHLDRVTLAEPDVLPDAPAPRKGVPQARHTHLLWSGGARAIEDLVPGTTQRWLDAGARRIGMPGGIVSLSAQGWLRRWPGLEHLIISSRDLIDWGVRHQVLADTRVTLRQGVRATALSGDAARVTGVVLRDEATGESTTVEADLVVDATGRGSRAPAWLTALGLPGVTETVIDSGLAYATRVFHAPEGAGRDVPVINVQADPREPRPGRTATLVPIEGDRWQVTLSGTRGGEPPRDAEGFVAFARAVRHPVVGDLIAGARPAGPVHSSRGNVNRRRFFERLPAWPDGFLVLGDAVATYNPVYGHGMSVAAHGARALGDQVGRRGLAPGTARAAQRAVAGAVEGAWTTATSQDVLYPETVGPRPPVHARVLQRYVERLMATANTRSPAARALYTAFTLSGPMTALVSPGALVATARGPRAAPVPEPPFTREERRALALPVLPAGG
ncbi:FAD-dependent oxidoreductase [Streptomyces sp. TRM 70351]|uniref:NAD(P)/FAD-dependent oxidoreductase n=1 Tax=Streptomyces sp. TRM 70351 TaxID=3116552 RepID=UPI002E7B2668|nr:FAD-dependent oxidoreductase [Streptomyces sp. TRM 70351]MEE1929206.1 FAD-dependent oxidoreductase [Streptomyces sp. TRM 70351]